MTDPDSPVPAEQPPTGAVPEILNRQPDGDDHEVVTLRLPVRRREDGSATAVGPVRTTPVESLLLFAEPPAPSDGPVLGEELVENAVQRAAATLQARMQWKQAEACAADLRSTFEDAVRAAEQRGAERERGRTKLSRGLADELATDVLRNSR